MLWLFALVAVSVGFDRSPPSPRVYEPHNIIVILADDLGVDMIRAYDRFYNDHPHPNFPNTTPSIDYLAKTGMLFVNAWTNPVCSPSRAQVLTGRHAFRSGIGKVVSRNRPVGNGPGLQLDIDTIPSMLRNPRAPFPYHTAAVGKWHLADPSQHPPRTGRLHPLGSPARPWFHQFAGRIYNLTVDYNTWTKIFATEIDPRQDQCVPPPRSFCSVQVHEYNSVDTADDAIHLIETMPEPFFLYVPFNAVHAPILPPDTALQGETCNEDQINGDPECDFGPGIPRKVRCMVQWLDNEIGRLICAVEDSPLKPELPTTIIFTADNGTSGDATKLPFDATHGKGTLYEGGVHVPFVVKSPVIPRSARGSVSKALVGSTDIFQTVSDLAFAPRPPDPFQLRDSVSILPYLQGQIRSVRKYVYAENFKINFVPSPDGNPPPSYGLIKHRRAIRNSDGFKLMQTVKRTRTGRLLITEELYNLNIDPHEQTNLIDQNDAPAYAQHYAGLRHELDVHYPHLVAR